MIGRQGKLWRLFLFYVLRTRLKTPNYRQAAVAAVQF